MTATSTRGTALMGTGPFTSQFKGVAGPVFNILSYGAAIDGVTDDLAAWNAAISDAQAAGGIVYHPGGVSVVSAAPQITGANVVVRGEGDASVILLAPASMTATGQVIGLWVNGGSNVLIENLCVDGNFANIAKSGGTVVPSTFGGGSAALGAAITTTPSPGTSEAWTVNAAASTASAAYSGPFTFKVDSEVLLCTAGFGTTSWTVLRGLANSTPATHSNGASIVSSNGTLFDATITAYGSGTPKTYESTFWAGSIDSNNYLTYRMPIRITNAENVVVRNCLLRNSVSAGVIVDATSVNGCTDVLITGNRIQKTWDNGVYFHKGVQYGAASDNLISDTMYNGVAAIYCDHILATGNNIRQAGPSFSDSGGIQFGGSSNCTAQGNEIDACQFYGVEVEASQETNITGGLGGNEAFAFNTVISGNSITGCHAANYPSQNSPGINVFGARATGITDNIIDNCDYGISMGSKAIDTFISANRITRCKSLGINVGNSPDVVQTTIENNFVAWNGSSGIFSNAQVVAVGNIFLGNTNFGIDLSSAPSGSPRKVDYIAQNYFADNTDSGIHTGGGAASLAVIERNTFTNSQGVLFADGVTNGTTTFTSATANFTSADVGRVLIIMVQGPGSTTTATTIASVTNSTTVVLAATPPGSGQSGLLFLLGRGPQYFADGSTTTAANSALNSATAAFSSADVGELVVLLSLDATPSVLGVTTVNSFVSSTQVTLGTDVGTITACGFWINRAQGQTGKAINNFSGYPVIERNNAFHGLPEYQDAGGVHNWVQPAVQHLARRPVADHDYTVQAGDQLVALTSLTAARTITLPAGLGSAGLPYFVDVKDESGTAAAHNVTLSVSGGGTIDGAASLVLASNYQRLRVYSTGSNWFSTPALIDTVAADIQPVGNQAAGSSGLAADAKHVHPSALWQPADQGLITETFDIATAGNSGAAMTSGVIYFARLRIPKAQTITNVSCVVAAAGAGVTTALFGLYDANGNQVAVTADRHADAVWTAGTGIETVPFTSAYAAAAGLYWVALLLVFSTTSPGVGRLSAISAATVNIGLSAGAGNLRFAQYSTGGQTALPASFTPSSQMTADNHAWWFGLS